MKYLYLLIIQFLIPMQTAILFDFTPHANTNSWRVVNDGVMGGVSKGNFKISQEGHGIFEGYVSLENNGGFSSVRHHLENKKVTDFSKISIRLKGDGSTYQFRVKSKSADRHSYNKTIETSGDWETIVFEFSEMYPVFRGRQLDIPNYSGEILEEIAFLIGNKKEERFKLEMDKISLL